MHFDADYDAVPEGSEARAELQRTFAENLAADCGLDPSCVRVLSITRGSIVIEYEVIESARAHSCRMQMRMHHL